MSSVLNLIKSLPVEDINENNNLVMDINYIRKSANLVNDALQKGSDIMQLSNGDIVITEVKTITYKYMWNKETNKFERTTSGSRVKKKRVSKSEKEAAND